MLRLIHALCKNLSYDLLHHLLNTFSPSLYQFRFPAFQNRHPAHLFHILIFFHLLLIVFPCMEICFLDTGKNIVKYLCLTGSSFFWRFPYPRHRIPDIEVSHVIHTFHPQATKVDCGFLLLHDNKRTIIWYNQLYILF